MVSEKEAEIKARHGEEAGHDPSLRIAEAVARIVRSPRFKASPQLQSLLQYVVSEAGDEDALKERMIGIHVFGRRPDYDTTNDPIVRSRMGLLRKRLAQFYESEDREHEDVRIVIPIGAYRPSFTLSSGGDREEREISQPQRSPRPALSVEPPESTLPQTTQMEGVRPESARSETAPSLTMLHGMSIAAVIPWRPKAISRLIVVVLTTVAVLILTSTWITWRGNSHRELDALWAPLVKSKQPIYVYTGTIPVFEEASPMDEAVSPEDRASPVRVPEPPSVDAPVPGPARVSSWGEGMLTGSVYADIRLAALLNGYKRTPVMRTGANLPFMDLKGSPLILVGSFDNYWTRVVNENLPFYLDRGFGIRERDGVHRRWFNPLKAEMTPRMMEDYALVFRVLSSKSGAPVMGIVGLSTCGTHAAADFVTDPVQMRALAGVPQASLENKNIELVLHASLVNCAPTSVEVIASKVW